MKPLCRPAHILAAAALLAAATPTSVRAAKFPPLNTPAVAEHHPGKLVWADLFTTDPDDATKFYCNLLGWTASALDRKGQSYTIFSNDGRPVAGLAPRSVQGANHPARWIGYLAVPDITSTLETVTKDGGTVHAPSRNFPERGYEAIVADRDGVPVGLLQSSTGDAPDNEPKPGDWNWFELYVKSPKASVKFYQEAIGFEVAPETKPDRKNDLTLFSGGEARGGIAPLPDGENVNPSWLGVIRVADLDKTLAKVPALGGEVLLAPHPVEYGTRFAIILDSTGGTVGLVQYMDDANPANSQ